MKERVDLFRRAPCPSSPSLCPTGRPDDERRRPQTEHLLHELSHGGQRASETAQHGPGDFQGDGEGWHPVGRGE